MKRLPAGVIARHSRTCSISRQGAKRCTCTPAYQATVSLGETGKRATKTFPTAVAADAWRRGHLRAVRSSRSLPLDQIFAAYLERVESGAARNKSGQSFLPSTLRGYRQVINATLGPRLGAVRLCDLEARHGRRLIDDLLREGKSPQTVRTAVQVLRSVLGDLRRREQYDADPLTTLVLPPSDGVRERFATKAEYADLVAAAPEQDRLAWMLAGYAGLRLSEIRALDWSDVDEAHGVLHVTQARPEAAKVAHRPKSRAGLRTVPLPRVLIDALAGARHRTRAMGLVAPVPTPRAFQIRADKHWREAGLRRITPHEARHTYASMMVAAGVPIADLSEFLGHSDIQLTIKRYRHMYGDARETASAALDRFLAAT